ncbi:hypothetical protein [Kibdelosporangium phytohabitans]|uniref:hypothetical protein n=1 Tax=Kibdelosporangium phytohabitans TaxID=860235 RepID=UPI0012F8C09C|nr:hypothetical protein [Kibdelosporangium phytohabitans]MBE1461933.1 hypothetical protein [Kibdelosporangium phytohabitans]
MDVHRVQQSVGNNLPAEPPRVVGRDRRPGENHGGVMGWFAQEGYDDSERAGATAMLTASANPAIPALPTVRGSRAGR